jgi:hypothetical protein
MSPDGVKGQYGSLICELVVVRHVHSLPVAFRRPWSHSYAYGMIRSRIVTTSTESTVVNPPVIHRGETQKRHVAMSP